MAVMGFITLVVVLGVIISISKSTTHFRCSKCLGYLTYWLKSEHFLCSFFTSITNIYEASGTFVTNNCFAFRTSLGTFRRVGKVVQFEMTDNVKAKNTTTSGATYTYLTIPNGFKPVQNMYMQNMYWLNNEKEHQITFIAQPNGQLNARVWWINSTTQDVGLLLGATWITNDTTPSQ